MKKYRKKLNEVEAIQWTGRDNYSEIVTFTGLDEDRIRLVENSLTIYCVNYQTIKVELNDYIVKDNHGDFYCLKEDLFLETYEQIKGNL